MSSADWWDGLYRNGDVRSLPWYTPDLDPDFEATLTKHGLEGVKILDLGTGPATQAMSLAKRGFDVIGTDISPSAIRKAKAAAKDARLGIEFRVDNIVQSNLDSSLVDVIVDRGVFHTLDPEDRPAYVEAVRRVLRPGGWLFLKCFSDKEPGTYGPHRISAKELRSHFQEMFDIASIVDTVFQGTLRPTPRALFATFHRRESSADRGGRARTRHAPRRAS